MLAVLYPRGYVGVSPLETHMPKPIAYCLLCLVCFVLLPAGAAVPDRPNILFIFADDFAYDCVGALGNDQVKTPTLDHLVENGTTFMRAYNMGSYSGAVCIASRMRLISLRISFLPFHALP